MIRKGLKVKVLTGKDKNKEGEIIDIGVSRGVVEKSGSWYSFNGNRIGQGRENAKKYLIENKEISDEIESLIRGNDKLEDSESEIEKLEK